jgi:hypothetical protein
MTYMRIKTQTGEAMIVMTEVVAIVRHYQEKEGSFNVDLHMKSGTIFVIQDYNEADYNALLNMWEMFNREQWEPRSPGFIKDGEMCEL